MIYNHAIKSPVTENENTDRGYPSELAVRKLERKLTIITKTFSL
jgi:hypothetical protein